MSEPLIQTPGVFGENDNFLLERELGSGGMGGVYMGRDKMLDRPVAVKVMLRELGSDAAFVERFKKEAQSVAKLIHPNIAQVYSYGLCNGMPYMAMELASGGSLYSVMSANRGKADVTRVLKICQQVAQALQCASDQGFVHGDVKPENILLDANGNAKLVDFGLAAMQKDTDEIWGTPYYIAPEKVRKEPVDFRADIYSLGGTLYHALTGVAPFEGADATAVVKKRFEIAPKKPSEIRADLTPAIDKLVLKMLAFNKEDRFPSFEALIESFREVLTTGLTATAAAPAETKPATKPTAPGAKRPMTVRGRRVMLKRPGGASAAEISAAKDVAAAPADEDDEEGGNLGAKVFGAVFGVIALIGLVVGGLVWYQIADKKAQAAENQKQIDAGIGSARGAIAQAKENVETFMQEKDNAAESAIAACRKTTERLKGVLPDDQYALLDPGPTKELLDAIAATNAAAQAESDAANAKTNAPAAASGDAMAAAVAAAVQAALAKAQLPAATGPKFRPPTEEEMDPASPEGQKYLEEKEKFYADLKAGKVNSASTNAAPAPEAAPVTSAPAVKPPETPEAVTDMNSLWERAYACKAAAIRIRMKGEKILKDCADAEAIKGNSREVGEKLAALSQSVKADFESLKANADVQAIAKALGFIKSKGDKTVEQTIKRLKKEKLEKERKEEEERLKREEEERKIRLAKERAELVAKETEDAKSAFDAVVVSGKLRQFEWKLALGSLKSLHDSFKTPEGQAAVNLQIRKVNDMKMVHDIFIKNLKDYVFTRGKKLKGCKVLDVDDRNISIQKPGVPGKKQIGWQSFYKEYTANLNELFNLYIVNAHKPDSKYRISNTLEWCNAMTGAALTMTLVCSEATGATERAQQLMTACVSNFPDYEKTAHEIFPDMTIEVKSEEE